MKKYLYITLLAIIGLYSCDVENGDFNGYKTQAGYSIFLTTESNIDDHLFLTEMIERISLYASSSDEEKKWINQIFLSDYIISQEDQSWIVKNENTQWNFSHNGKSITEKGSKWALSLTKKRDNGESVTLIAKNSFIIENIGDNNLKINSSELISNIASFTDTYTISEYSWDDLKNRNKVTGELIITPIQKSENKSYLYETYGISNSGKIQISNGINIDCSISSTSIFIMREYGSNYMMVEGDIDLSIKLKENIEDKINIKAKNDVRTVTMGGITEEYYSF